jgi:uncharacterized repeat protein (TIGR03803 family)
MLLHFYPGKKNQEMKLKLVAIFTFVSALCSGQYSVIYSLNWTSGKSPYGPLYFDGANLFGTTKFGNQSEAGILYKIDPAGTAFVIEKVFGNTNTFNPAGGVASDGAFLYGVTCNGGPGSLGAIYSLNKQNGAFSIVQNLTYTTGATGRNCTPIHLNGFLYGSLNGGGSGDAGVVFKAKIDGTSYTKLYEFSGGVNGEYPEGILCHNSGYLFGTTYAGGANGDGTIFKMLTDGSSFSKLLDFKENVTGKRPGSVITDGTWLYGMTTSGGAYGFGTVYKVKTDGTAFTKLLDFEGQNGNQPYNTTVLTMYNGMLYGVTDVGGDVNRGVIYRINTNGSGYVKMHDFSADNEPSGPLIIAGDKLFGTSLGPFNSNSYIYKIDPLTVAVGLKDGEIKKPYKLSVSQLSRKATLESTHPLDQISIKVSNIAGQEILAETELTERSITFRCDGLAPGIYVVRAIRNNNVVFSSKLVLAD